MAAAALTKSPKPQKTIASLSKLLTKPSPISSSSISDPDPIARIKSQIRSEPDPDRLASLFLSSCSAPKFHGDRSIYKFSIQKLDRCNRRDLIERILEYQRSDPALPRSEGFLIRILTLYSEAGMVDHALRTFESIPDAGLKHSERTLCALLTVFLKNRKFQSLTVSFTELPEKIKVSPGITAHNIMLQGFCDNDDVDAARSLFDEMVEKKKIKPDVVTYNAMFNGYLKKKDEEGCDWVLKEMSANGLEANVVTFNCRVALLCGKGRSFEAEELLDVMGMKKVRPNRNTFNMVIEGFCKEGNVKKAMRVFERIKNQKENDENGASPSFETYIMLVRSLVENGEFGKGLEVVKECLERKWAPPFGAVRALVEGLKKDSKVNEAKDVVARMRKVVKGDAMEAWKNIEASISF